MPTDDRPPFALNPPRPPRVDGGFDVLAFEIVPGDPEQFVPDAVWLSVDGVPVNRLLNDENSCTPVWYFNGPSMPRSTTRRKRIDRPARVLLTCCRCGFDGCGSTVGRLRRLKDRIVIDELKCGAHRTDEVFTFEPAQFDQTLRAIWQAIEHLPNMGSMVR